MLGNLWSSSASVYLTGAFVARNIMVAILIVKRTFGFIDKI